MHLFKLWCNRKCEIWASTRRQTVEPIKNMEFLGQVSRTSEFAEMGYIIIRVSARSSKESLIFLNRMDEMSKSFK